MGEYINNLKNKLLYKLHLLVFDENAEKYVKEKLETATVNSESFSENSPDENSSDNKTTKKVIGKTIRGIASIYGFKQPALLEKFKLLEEGFRSKNVAAPIVKNDVSGADVDSEPAPEPEVNAKSILAQTMVLIIDSLPFIFSTIFAMIVANQFIVHPWIIRIIMFIFTFVMLLINPILMFAFFIYFIGRISYVAYRNSRIKTENPDITDPVMLKKLKKSLLPHIFALLPIITDPPQSRLGNIFKYPFYYPKTDKSRQTLNDDMNSYIEYIKSGIVDVKFLESKFPELGQMISKFIKDFSEMHKPSEQPTPVSQLAPTNPVIKNSSV